MSRRTADEIRRRIAAGPMLPLVFHSPSRGPWWRRAIARATDGALCRSSAERFVFVDDDGEVLVVHRRPAGVEVREWDDDA